MPPSLTVVGLAVLLAVASLPATARGAAQQAPAAFPMELVNRPLTLPRGTIEMAIPLDLSLSSDRIGEPISLAPSAYYGVTDAFTFGVRHFRGLCFTGSERGCPNVYSDLSLDALVRLWRGGGAEVALGGALNAAPIDPFTLAMEVRVVARWTGGPFAFALAPALSIGLNDRDSTPIKTIPIAFPLSTYTFGSTQDVTGNREILAVPATVQVQVIPPLAVIFAGALLAPIDPLDGSPTDYATFPIGAAVIVTPGSFDVGASITFTNTLGRERWPGTRAGEVRFARLWVALRL